MNEEANFKLKQSDNLVIFNKKYKVKLLLYLN